MSNQKGITSYLKFGDWDQEGLLKGSRLNMFTTIEPTSWYLKSNSFFLGQESFMEDTNKLIDLNPHLPYLYIPDNDWRLFAYKLENKFLYVDCTFKNNYCKF